MELGFSLSQCTVTPPLPSYHTFFAVVPDIIPTRNILLDQDFRLWRRNTPTSTLQGMNRNVGKRTIEHVRPTRILIGIFAGRNMKMRLRTVSSESSMDAFWIVKDAKFLHADNEDSDQTAQMRRMI